MQSTTVEFRRRAEAALNQILVSRERADRALILETRFEVLPEPRTEMLRELVKGGKIGQGDTLLGLYTSPPPTVTIFQGPIEGQQTYTLEAVLAHEVGHRLSYDHQLEEIVHACGIKCQAKVAADLRQPAQPIPAGVRAVETRDCPFCRLDDELTLAKGKLEGLVMASSIEQRIPPGVGGTIPLIRQHLARAGALLPAVAAKAPGRAGELRGLARCLQRAQAALSGQLSLEQVSAASRQVSSCWAQSYRLAWWWYSRSR